MTQPNEGITLVSGIWWALGILGTAFFGSFLGGYMKKRGENLATHEDLERLVEQVRAVTQATKEIEAKISDTVWDRQKRWELRRDTLLDVVKRLTELDEALTKLYSVKSVATKDLSVVPGAAASWQESWTKALHRWTQASDDFTRTKLIAVLVSGKDVVLTLQEFEKLCSAAANNLAIKNDGELFCSSSKDRSAAMFGVLRAIRNELQLKELSAEQVPRS